MGGIVLFPAALPPAPWYAILVSGSWEALVVSYGGGFLAGLLYFIGAQLGRQPVQP